jgi:hypothetical protein
MGSFDHARSHSAAPSRIPRTGKGKQTKIPDIARELGVVNVLEGSIRRSGDHLRVTAQPLKREGQSHWGSPRRPPSQRALEKREEHGSVALK